MTYTVYYRLKSSKFWQTVKNVKGDGLLPGNAHRYLILQDESRLEIPMEGTEFKFSRERFLIIKQNMEKESGLSLPLQS